MARVLLLLVAFFVLCSPAAAQSSLYFDGTDYATVGDPLNFSGGPFTVEAWVRIDSTSGGRVICNRDGPNGYEIFYSNSDQVIASSINGSWDASAEYASLGEWFHIAWTHSGSPDYDSILYINGVPVATNSWWEDIQNSLNGMTIGAFPGGGAGMTGSIDDVRFWSAVLSQETIAAWYTQRVDAEHPNIGSLVANYEFDEGSGNTAHSTVNSPIYDATFASGANAPTWESDHTPVLKTTIGGIKRAFIDPRR